MGSFSKRILKFIWNLVPWCFLFHGGYRSVYTSKILKSFPVKVVEASSVRYGGESWGYNGAHCQQLLLIKLLNHLPLSFIPTFIILLRTEHYKFNSSSVSLSTHTAHSSSYTGPNREMEHDSYPLILVKRSWSLTSNDTRWNIITIADIPLHSSTATKEREVRLHPSCIPHVMGKGHVTAQQRFLHHTSIRVSGALLSECCYRGGML